MQNILTSIYNNMLFVTDKISETVLLKCLFLLLFLFAFTFGLENLKKNKQAVFGKIKTYILSLLHTPGYKSFHFEIGATSRGIIYVVDLIIVLSATLVNVALFTGQLDFTSISLQIGFSLAAHAYTFIWFNTYIGSIRHSNFYDALKLFVAVGSAFVLLFVVDQVYISVAGRDLFTLSYLIYGLALTYLGVMLFRIAIKTIFGKFNYNLKLDEGLRAVIYGVDAKSVSLGESMLMDENCKFKIIAFISLHKSRSNNSIMERPIVTINHSLGKTMDDLRASTLILVTETLSEKEIFTIAEECLKNNIKIYTAPLVSFGSHNRPVSAKLRDLRIDDLLSRDPIHIDMDNLTSFFKDKVVLVTGGAGSIGSELVLQLADVSTKLIIVFDISESAVYNLEMHLLTHFPNRNILTLIGDVTQPHDIEKVFRTYRPNFVFHASAYKHVPLMEKHPDQAIKVNILGTKIVADLSIKYGVESFVLISTDKAVNPVNVMGTTKRVAELYTQSISKKWNRKNLHTTQFLTTRFGNVLGSNGSVVPLFKKQINEGGPLTVTHPDMTRYFMTIPEACQLVLVASSMGSDGDIFLFDMGVPIKIMDLALKMIKIAGLEPHKDIEIKITGLRPGEKLTEELYNALAQIIPTENPKIVKVTEGFVPWNDFNRKLIALFENLHAVEAVCLIEQLKQMLPEYRTKLKSISVNQIPVTQHVLGKMK